MPFSSRPPPPVDGVGGRVVFAVPFRGLLLRHNFLAEGDHGAPDILAPDHSRNHSREREIFANDTPQDTALHIPRRTNLEGVLRRVPDLRTVMTLSRRLAPSLLVQVLTEAPMPSEHLHCPERESTLPPIHPVIEDRVDGPDSSEADPNVGQPLLPLLHCELPELESNNSHRTRCRDNIPLAEGGTQLVERSVRLRQQVPRYRSACRNPVSSCLFLDPLVVVEGILRQPLAVNFRVFR